MAQQGTVVFSSDMLVGHKQLYTNGADTRFGVHIVSGAFPSTPYRIKNATAGFVLRNATWASVLIRGNGEDLGSFGQVGTNGERACALKTGFAYANLNEVAFYGRSDGSQLASGSTVTVTVVWELTDVPTTVTVTKTADAGGTVKATLHVSIAGYRHRLTYALGGQSITKDLAAGVSSHTLTIPMDWCAEMPNAVQGGANVTVTSYDGNRLIGTRSANFTVRVPASIVPAISAFDAAPINQRLGLTLQGVSGARLTAEAAGAYGSTIRSISFHADGRSAAGSPAEIPRIQAAGDVSCAVTVTDSRGRAATQSRTISVTAYDPPMIVGVEHGRCDPDGTANPNGDRVKWQTVTSFSAVGGNSLTLVIERKGTAGWEEVYRGAPQEAWSVLPQSFDVQTAFRLRYTLSDAVTGAQPVEMRLKTGYTYMRWDPAKRAFGFGIYPQHENSFELDPDASFWTHGQEIQQLIQSAFRASMLAAHPVGSLYFTVGNEDPAQLFGGEWIKLDGKFIRAVSSGAGEVAGSNTQTLSVANLPNQQGVLSWRGSTTGTNFSGASGVFSNALTLTGKARNGGTQSTDSDSVARVKFNNGGQSAPFSVMPEHICVYAWKRTK